MSQGLAALRQLARLHGIQTAFYDMSRVRRSASSEALLRTLQALGVPIADAAQAPEALQASRAEFRARQLEPVLVAWEGELGPVPLRTGGVLPGDRMSYEIQLEDGTVRQGSAQAVARRLVVSPDPVAAKIDLSIMERVPLGYHTLQVETHAGPAQARVIAAPRRARGSPGRHWGVFAPLHAYRSARSQGIGDFTDLAKLCRWIGSQGGNLVGTLPLLPSFLDRPCDPSPYLPVSRLFWNEIFLDLGAFGEKGDPLPGPPGSVADNVAATLVDYPGTAARKRSVLQPLADAFFQPGGGSRSAAFQAFLRQYPHAREYARFRAAQEVHARRPGARPGSDLLPHPLPGALVAEERRRYHLFVQFQAHQQLTRVLEARNADSAELYLDLPIGVHPAGFDRWRWRELFARNATAGAPPDPLFRGGQDWGFAPLRPAALRRTGYEYVIACLRHHFRFARVLRLDHVMSLQRLYWVPAGLSATAGVYVRYPRDELTAVLLLEAQRHAAVVVGEDLGTVPAEIRAALGRHGLHRMYVLQYEAQADRHPPLPTVPRRVVASLNTHDMPPFAAFWQGQDIAEERRRGLLAAAAAKAARDQRRILRTQLGQLLNFDGSSDSPAGVRRALLALLRFLARSPASILLINLEDLWLETTPQNEPGTGAERPNWRRLARRSLDDLAQSADVRAVLTRLHLERHGQLPVDTPTAARPHVLQSPEE